MRQSGLGHFPLGQSIPPKEHAVCVSLPTVRDLVGYEEKKPETLSKLSSGYPRFVRHRKIETLSRFWNQKDSSKDCINYFFTNLEDWDFAKNTIPIGEAEVKKEENYLRVKIPENSASSREIQKFIQHVGCGMSSRHAESILESIGLVCNSEFVQPNPLASNEIKDVIAKAHGPEINSTDVLLTNSGANSFTSAFRASLQLTRSKNKHVWIRLGWLYLDTIEIMELLTRENETIISLNHPDQFESINNLFEKYGDKIAGVVTEFPSNPLLHSCDLEQVSQLCRIHNSLLIVDPTMASPKNAKVCRYADIVINSLTKYANWEGDVMLGSLVFPSFSPLGLEVREYAEQLLTPPFSKDLERLAEQIQYYENFISKTNESLSNVVEFLKSHPKIKEVYWAYQEKTRINYEKIAGTGKPGCVVSFEIDGNFELFYNSLAMLKSPSFGTEFSICCPYVYLAHYDKITSKDGMKELSDAGLVPELCRLSVGLEDPNEIKVALDRALYFA